MQRGFDDLVVECCVLVVGRARLLRCDDSDSASIGTLSLEAATEGLAGEDLDPGGTKASFGSDKS